MDAEKRSRLEFWVDSLRIFFIGVHRRPSAAEFLGTCGFFPERPNGPDDLFLRVPAVDEKSQPRGFFGNRGIQNGLGVDAAHVAIERPSRQATLAG